MNVWMRRMYASCQEGCWFNVHIIDKGALSLKLDQNQCMYMDYYQKYEPITHLVTIYTNAYHIRNVNQLIGQFVDYASASSSM